MARPFVAISPMLDHKVHRNDLPPYHNALYHTTACAVRCCAENIGKVRSTAHVKKGACRTRAHGRTRQARLYEEMIFGTFCSAAHAARMPRPVYVRSNELFLYTGAPSLPSTHFCPRLSLPSPTRLARRLAPVSISCSRESDSLRTLRISHFFRSASITEHKISPSSIFYFFQTCSRALQNSPSSLLAETSAVPLSVYNRDDRRHDHHPLTN